VRIDQRCVGTLQLPGSAGPAVAARLKSPVRCWLSALTTAVLRSRPVGKNVRACRRNILTFVSRRTSPADSPLQGRFRLRGPRFFHLSRPPVQHRYVVESERIATSTRDRVAHIMVPRNQHHPLFASRSIAGRTRPRVARPLASLSRAWCSDRRTRLQIQKIAPECARLRTGSCRVRDLGMGAAFRLVFDIVVQSKAEAGLCEDAGESAVVTSPSCRPISPSSRIVVVA